jgi:hypothetical protein
MIVTHGNFTPTGCRKNGHVAGNCHFSIHDGNIAEKWVSRDELGMLIELGDKDQNIATRDRGLKLKLGTIDGTRIVALIMRGRTHFAPNPPLPFGVDQVNQSAYQRQHRPRNS